MILYHLFVFFFKQKTSYVMRISYWSSDVCSSDLDLDVALDRATAGRGQGELGDLVMAAALVFDRELDALVRDRLDQLPAALAHLLDVRRPGQLGADARRRAGLLEIRLRVAQCQGVTVREEAQVVDVEIERAQDLTPVTNAKLI